MRKVVSFKKSETDLIDYVSDKDFSYYVKDLIRQDMKRHLERDKIVNKNKRNSSFIL